MRGGWTTTRIANRWRAAIGGMWGEAMGGQGRRRQVGECDWRRVEGSDRRRRRRVGTLQGTRLLVALSILILSGMMDLYDYRDAKGNMKANEKGYYYVPAVKALGWPWGEGSTSERGPKPPPPPPTQRGQLAGSAVAFYETEREGAFASHRPLIQEAQSLSAAKKNSLDASCWQQAYRQLYSSCRDILRDEEKKCRLAYQMTVCFLKMTGWPAPPNCPPNQLVRFCTEKFDEHTHSLYLAFFVDTASMCHHIQSEAFKKETESIINELKDSGVWVLDKLEDVKVRSDEILKSTSEQSQKLEEKLIQVESASHTLLEQSLGITERLKSTQSIVDSIHEQQYEIQTLQVDLKEKHAVMSDDLHQGMKGLEEATQKTHEQLGGISEGQKQILKEQHELADALAGEIQRLKDNALESLEELKDSQASAMEETRFSLRGLAEGAKKAQVNFDAWRLDMDEKSERLVKGSQAMLHAQEAFVSRQGSILSTLDRLFSLYDSILFESRALKIFLFYGTSLVFVQVLTSAKQTHNARIILYVGLCASMIIEVYLMRAYGNLMIHQQWVHSRSYWVRGCFGTFAALVILYSIITFRDISWRNHQLLLELHDKLNGMMSRTTPETLNYATSMSEEDHFAPICVPTMFSLPPSKSSTHTSLAQSIASKIIRRVHKFMRARRHHNTNQKKVGRTDIFKIWMESHGMDTSMLDNSDSSEDDETSSMYEKYPHEDMQYRPYTLRSDCQRRCLTRHIFPVH